MRLLCGIVCAAGLAGCIYHPVVLTPTDGSGSGDRHAGGDAVTHGDPGAQGDPVSGDSSTAGDPSGDSTQPGDPVGTGDNNSGDTQPGDRAGDFGPQPADPVSLGDAGPLIVDSDEEAWLENAGSAAGCVTGACTSWGFTFTIDSGGWVVNIDGDHINPVSRECLEQMVANVRFPNRANDELSASIPCV